jgi:hypothetical protein
MEGYFAMGSVSVEWMLAGITRQWHHYRWVLYENETSRVDLPTVDEINALPEKFRRYIHDLETRCDKSGDVQTIAILREDRDALQRRVEELEAQDEAVDSSQRRLRDSAIRRARATEFHSCGPSPAPLRLYLR